VSLVGIRHPEPASAPVADQPAFERVMKTGTLRCAYISIPPHFVKDLNTGKYSGTAYEVAEGIGQSLNLKIDWVEEVNFGNLAEGLRTGRYDAVCFALYLGNVSMARVVDYTIPLFYTGTGVYVRADDHRFDDNFAALNSPDVTIATMDAEMSQFIRAQNFPAAKDFSLPQNSDIAELLESVAEGKADVTFFDQAHYATYLKANPGKLRDLALHDPIRIHAHSFVVGEIRLEAMLNTAIREMLLSGRIDEIIKRYEGEGPQSGILPVAKPYAPP
jgi:ABC-type amino acid transport substrate-binding protein